MSRFGKGEVKGAIRTLQRNKGRSLLTMFGIVIGVASVVTVVAIGEGIKDQIQQQTDQLGKDLITIRPGELPTNISTNTFNSLAQLGNVGMAGTLSSDDVSSVQKTPGVAAAVPMALVGGGVSVGDKNKHYNTLVIGSAPGLPGILHQTLAYGGFFDNTDFAADKVVLGSHIAAELYAENVPLGQTLKILGHQFIVTGIFNDFASTPLSFDADFNNAVFISYPSALSITNNDAPIYEILARPSHPSQTTVVVHNLDRSLLNAHGGQHDFTVLDQSQTIGVANTILDLLTVLIAGVAAISLLVGGVGIMNVTLVSITERMHEIGIRKAIGATNRQILWQFVIEAAVLSIVGAALGVILSYIIEISLRLATNLTPSITWSAVVVACFASVVVGMAFGTLPALKAARKDPISALRGE